MDRAEPIAGERPKQRAWRTVAPVWAQVGSGALTPGFVERMRPLDRARDRNSDAEYDFYRLPARFQQSAEAILLPRERILAFVPWTAAVADSWRDRLRRRIALGTPQPAAGALVITDRHILHLRDDAEITGGIVHWGYTVRATAFERLNHVGLDQRADGSVLLTLELRAGPGREVLQSSYLASVADECRGIAALLQSFLPGANVVALRPPGTIFPFVNVETDAPRRGFRRPPVDPAVQDGREAVLQLEAILDELLGACGSPPRRVHAKAIIPSGSDPGPQLLAVTQDRFIVIPPPARGDAIAQDLATVTSVEFRHSVLGSHLAWTAGGAAGEPPARMMVPVPITALDACRRIFTALRQALTFLPVEAAGPDGSG